MLTARGPVISPHPEHPKQRWIGDYRAVCTAPRPDGLDEACRRTLRDSWKWVPFGCFPPVAILASLFWMTGHIRAQAESTTLEYTILFSTIVLSAISFLLFADSRKKVARTKLLLNATEFERFELSQAVLDDIAAASALGRHHHGTNEPRTLVVSSELRAIVQADDRLIVPPRIRSIVEIAPQPETITPTHSDPSQPDTPTSSTRDLTESELDELRTVIRNLSRLPLPVRVTSWLFLAMFLWVLSIIIVNRTFPEQDTILAILVLIIYPASTIYLFRIKKRNRALARKLTKDLDAQTIDIIAWEHVLEEAKDDPEMNLVDPMFAPGSIERLHHSKLVWSADSTPSPWRRVAWRPNKDH